MLKVVRAIWSLLVKGGAFTNSEELLVGTVNRVRCLDCRDCRKLDIAQAEG